jgi:hypothetical protein
MVVGRALVGHGRKDPLGGVLASQSLQERQPAGSQQVLDSMTQRSPDARQLHQSAYTLGLQDLLHRSLQLAQGAGSATVGLHTERVCALCLQQIRDFFQRRADLLVRECLSLARG